jgi:endonuclease/exonuclease/phosphatase (EEP) superfamily protein YafD
MTARDVLTSLFSAGATGCWAFITLYAWRSRGWHRLDVGRNLMAMMVVLGVLLTLVVFNRQVGIPIEVWLILLTVLDIVIWWRVVILWRRQHERRRR